MKKNVLSIILIFAVVFSLALVSCGSDEPEQSTADSSKTEVSNQEEVSNSVPKITDSLYANADKTILSPGDTVTIKVGLIHQRPIPRSALITNTTKNFLRSPSSTGSLKMLFFRIPQSVKLPSSLMRTNMR